MSRFTLEQFDSFLAGVDLAGYHERFKIKIVEMDLPKNIQALDTIYAQYWDNIDNLDAPLDFDEYYKKYWETNEANIRDFWAQSGFGQDCDCFTKGLKARIYRTWASLITQIHGGYVAENFFGRGLVQMGTDLDHQNIDMLVVNSDGSERLRIQIKKKTYRREISRMQKNVSGQNNTVDIHYYVPTKHDYDNPLYKRNGKGYKKGDEKPFAKNFVKWHPTTGILDRLDNGFVVFTENAFKNL